MLNGLVKFRELGESSRTILNLTPYTNNKHIFDP